MARYGTVLILGGCIHNEGDLNRVALQPEPVLGPEIARATASAIWGKNRRGNLERAIDTSPVQNHNQR